ncbi:MAG: response regulator [bacterium]|nr:response regulator [bacterium]
MSLFKTHLKILLVEDSQPQIKLIAKVLSKIGGVETLLCHDAFEAYALLRASSRVDLVILDVNLPFSDGLGLLRKLRSLAEYQNLPVLMSTAQDKTEAYLNAGATGVLIKPYDLDQLKGFIESYRPQAS